MALGCERHVAYIYDRGGAQRLDVVSDVLSVRWNRVRDDISDAQVIVHNPGPRCARLLANISTGRHELVIYRGADRVWEGPITRLAYHRTQVEIEARDVMHYVYRTVLRSGYDNSSSNVTTCIQRSLNMLNGELARKEALTPPVNVLPNLVPMFAPGDSRTSRKTKPFQATVFEQIDDMAAKSGMDYTVVGRSIVLYDTHTIIGVAPQMTENDFIGDVVVTEYGMELTTLSSVTDGQDTYASAGVDTDPYYGNWEVLNTAFTEQEVGAEPPTEDELASQAVRNLDGRNPAPVDVRVPDGSRLNPNGAWDINTLIPGVRIPLVATLTARTVSQMQKLDKVQVVDTAGQESVMVTLSPASAADVMPSPGQPGEADGTPVWEENFTTLDLATSATTATARWRPNDVWQNINRGYKDFAGTSWNLNPNETIAGVKRSPFSIGPQPGATGNALTIKAVRIPTAWDADIAASMAAQGQSGGAPEWAGGILMTNSAVAGQKFKYGYFAIRARWPNPGRGMFPALWLYATDGSTDSLGKGGAEIDVFEVFGHAAGRPWTTHLHYRNNSNAVARPSLDVASTDSDTKGWHIYGVDWQPTWLRFYKDGVLVAEVTGENATWLNTTMSIRLNYAMDASWFTTQSDASTPDNLTMDVDWVKVWSSYGGS